MSASPPASSGAEAQPAGPAFESAESVLRWLGQVRPGLERLRACWEQRSEAAWARTPVVYTALAHHLVRAGDPFLAHDVATEGLRHAPEQLRLQQIQALALAQTGASHAACQLLEGILQRGAADAETLSLLARCHKDLWRHSPDAEERGRQLRTAYALYRRAFDQSQGHYPAINAATLGLLSGEAESARDLALRARDLAHARASLPEEEVWAEATLGEAALVLGDAVAARHHYKKMAAAADQDLSARGSARRQARLLLSYLGRDPHELDACFAIPPIAVFTTTPERAAARAHPGGAPALDDDALEARRADLAGTLARRRIRAGYASADSLTDLVFLDLLLDAEAEVHLVLPLAPEAVRLEIERQAGARPSAGQWLARFDRALASAASVTIASPEETEATPIALAYAERLLVGLARLRAQVVDGDFLYLWIGDEGRLCDSPWPPPLADLPAPIGGPAMPAREIRALLFADVSGYSRLPELQIPCFLRAFLPRLRDLCEQSPHRPDIRFTWGDAVYLGFRTTTAAGRFALALRDWVQAEPWREAGLTEDLRLRIGLHAGPVFVHHDPVVNLPSFAGTHVTRAARLEPIAEEGQIFATESFAALAATEPHPGFDLIHVGERRMAKDYGRVRAYLVEHGPAGGLRPWGTPASH